MAAVLSETPVDTTADNRQQRRESSQQNIFNVQQCNNIAQPTVHRRISSKKESDNKLNVYINENVLKYVADGGGGGLLITQYRSSHARPLSNLTHSLITVQTLKYIFLLALLLSSSFYVNVATASATRNS